MVVDMEAVNASGSHATGRGAKADEVVRMFQDAWNGHDVEAVMALMTEDCVFESTWPPPDGERVEGHARVRAFWDGFLQDNPHVRGVDVYRVRDGKVAEKLSYVKG